MKIILTRATHILQDLLGRLTLKSRIRKCKDEYISEAQKMLSNIFEHGNHSAIIESMMMKGRIAYIQMNGTTPLEDLWVFHDMVHKEALNPKKVDDLILIALGVLFDRTVAKYKIDHIFKED